MFIRVAYMLESSSFLSGFLLEVYYRGGWLCAAILTIFSIRARMISSIVIWSFLTFSFLFAQRGCWVIGSELGRIGNGGSPKFRWDRFNPVLDWPIVAGAVLFLTLLVLAIYRRSRPSNNWKKGYENARKSTGHK
jgi:hypothetical protein